MTKAAYAPHKVQNLRPLKDTVLVTDMQFKERKLNSGIILINDNGTTAGIRPRWGRVYAVGPDQKEYKPGDWICVSHGRWTRGVEIEDTNGQVITIRKVDPKDILLLSDERPSDDTMSDAVQVSPSKR
jgi:co-chaperonin GroES (HSP10)